MCTYYHFSFYYETIHKHWKCYIHVQYQLKDWRGWVKNVRLNWKWNFQKNKLEGFVMGMGVKVEYNYGYRGRGMGAYGGYPRGVRKFHVTFWEISRKMMVPPSTESIIVKWKLRISTISLKGNDPTDMLNLPIEYLRNSIFDVNVCCFTIPFNSKLPLINMHTIMFLSWPLLKPTILIENITHKISRIVTVSLYWMFIWYQFGM